MAFWDYLVLLLVFSVIIKCDVHEKPFCPVGAQIYLDDLRCYWQSTLTASWPRANQICQEVKGAYLASVDNAKVQNFLRSSFPVKNAVWVWVKQHQQHSFGLGTDSHQTRDKNRVVCSQMALGSLGQWRNADCSSEQSFICEKEVEVTLPSLDSCITGVPMMMSVYPMSQAKIQNSIPNIGQQMVEVMMFPGLWISHEGQVLSVDFVTRPFKDVSHARVQIFRPYCSPSHHLVPPGCSFLANPFSSCSLIPFCNTTGGCSYAHYWCPLLETCLPVTSPCTPYHTSTWGRTVSLPPRYISTPPFFQLMVDIPLTLPPNSDHSHISVLFEAQSGAKQSFSVYPDDILVVQHTRKEGEFLHCLAGSDSAWRQSYLSIPGAEWGGWWEGVLTSQPGHGQWVDDVICDLRVIYADILHNYVVSTTTDTNQQIGNTHEDRAVYQESPISGISVVYPTPKEGSQIHLQVNVPTVIVIKILSGGQNASSLWYSSIFQANVPFKPNCPPIIHDCDDTLDSWFSYQSVELSSQGTYILNITASNGVSSQSVTIGMQAHQPVKGLTVHPKGFHRMLVDIPQLFTAVLTTGSSVKFTWTIDGLVKFAYVGQTYSILFKKPSEHTVKVTAENPISHESVEFKLSVDVMVPMTEPVFLSEMDVISVNTPNLYIFQVKVDISIDLTISWDFGDNTSLVNHTFLPSNNSENLNQYQNTTQIYLQDTVQHKYSSPGDITMTVQAFNKFDRIHKAIKLKARVPLTRLLVVSYPRILQINQSLLLEALAQPSVFGVFYTWNFGDGSDEVKISKSSIKHVVKTSGTYNVTVSANNSLTTLTAWTILEIEELVSNLQLTYNGPNEMNSVTVINGTVSSGSHLLWSYDLADGYVQSNTPDSSLLHIYKSPGNYLVQVNVSNSISYANKSINVEIYRLSIDGISPFKTLVKGKEVTLRAIVKGNVSMLTFHWNFGDGTLTSIQTGVATTTHTYLSTGTFRTNVTVLSKLATAFYETNMSIEALITNFTLLSPLKAVAVGEEVCLNAVICPQSNNYQIQWYNSSPKAISFNGTLHQCFVFSEEGTKDISVVAMNKVSKKMSKTIVVVQRPVSKCSLEHTGNTSALTVNQSYTFWVSLCHGTNITIQWDFGDGSTKKQGHKQMHAFESSGTFVISVNAFNEVSQEIDTVEANLYVPVTNLFIYADPSYAEVGKETMITAVANTMNNISFFWSVDYSTPPKPSTSQLNYTFLQPGTHFVQVTAKNLVSQNNATTAIEVLEKITGVFITSKNLFANRYVPTNESVLLTASVKQGSGVTYQWLVNQEHNNNKTSAEGEHFQFFTLIPGDIQVDIKAVNSLGKVESRVVFTAMERVSGAKISTPVSTVAVGKQVKISLTVQTGTHIQYVWYIDSKLSPRKSDVPFLLHTFTRVGCFKVQVSVLNALGSINATKNITVQEEISGANFQINGQTSPFFVKSSYISSLQGLAETGNSLEWVWRVSRMNPKLVVLNNNQNLNYSFPDSGTFNVSLNVSNDVSWETVSHTVNVQDAIEGLIVNLSNTAICTEHPVNFIPLIMQGTDVKFTIEFDRRHIFEEFEEAKYTTSVLPVGNNLVTVKARNEVSSSVITVNVFVAEKVSGLSLVNCCSNVLETQKEISLKATVSTGSPIRFHWNFQLEGFKSTKAKGQHVYYTPSGNGSLSMSVTADNGVCSQTINKTTVVQSPVKEVKLRTTSAGTFTDHPVTFVAVTDAGSSIIYRWDFGDQYIIITESSTVDYTYKSPGRYLVQVNVSNNISQVSTHIFTEIQKLVCAQPQVSLVQTRPTIPKSRRSYFEAKVDLDGCTSYKAKYLWEVFSGPACNENDKISLKNKVEVTKPLLALPKDMLEVGSYCLKFSASYQGTPLNQQRSMEFSIIHSELVAIIKGGSHRVLSRHSSLILDGSESHDPDYGQEVDNDLHYDWDYNIQNTHSSILGHLVQSNRSTFSFPISELHPGKTYIFTLTVEKFGRPPVSTSQSIVVVDAQMIPLSISCMSCSPQYFTSYQQPIVLSGHCPACREGTQFKWSARNEHNNVFDLNNFTTSTGDALLDLVLRPTVLTEGLKYTFILNVSHPVKEYRGSASLTLRPKPPPYGGTCTLTPDNSIHFLETFVIYNCSGWRTVHSMASQLIYTLQVTLCSDANQLCKWVTLYRGTQQIYKTVVPIGNHCMESNATTISLQVKIEDSLGAEVIALQRSLNVLLPEEGLGATQWLMNKSQTEMWALVQQGNPQDVITYSIALISHLNQMKGGSRRDRLDRSEIRRNATQALASLPISLLQDAEQISSALVQSTAFLNEVGGNGCQTKVLESVEKMIAVIKDQARPGSATPIDTGNNILHILGGVVSAAPKLSNEVGASDASVSLQDAETVVSALGQAGTLMRSLMQSRLRGEEALSLTSPHMNAVGVRGGPASDLLCTDASSGCHFLIPPAFSSQLRKRGEDFVQILLDVEAGGSRLASTVHPPISTSLAAMEFTTAQGQPIPVRNLTYASSIRIRLPNRKPQQEGASWVNFTLPADGRVHFMVKAVKKDPNSGIYLAFNFSQLEGGHEPSNGKVQISVNHEQDSIGSKDAFSQEISLYLSSEFPTEESTIFLNPILNGTVRDLYLTVNSSTRGGPVQASVCVYSSLCQFFSVEEHQWSTYGLQPLDGSRPYMAHCLTQHLTVFGSSLFVHPDSIVLLPPSRRPVRNVAVGIVCAVVLLIHLLLSLIAHKLGHLESQRLSYVPLCGQQGRYKYRVVVKTGWIQGAGTSAHVGISLYGVNKSGSRHLQRGGAFQRNSLDDFQVETDANLGEIWKIRIWHDNTGLDPSWYLKHVTVWDMQADNLFFFIVEDWLSVENEKNSGMVEKEVLASCPQELRQFWRILSAQTVFGMLDRHLWISLWERPAHSNFSRAQRASCCALIQHLYLATAAVWFGAVGTKGAEEPISEWILVTPETILVGMTVAVVVFPFQLALGFIFRKTRAKVTTELSLPPSPISQTVEMDVYLSHPELSSSFLSVPGGPQSSIQDETSLCSGLSEMKKCEFWHSPYLGTRSEVGQWMSSDSVFGLPELTGPARLLKRKRGQLQLHLGSPTSDLSTPEPMNSQSSSYPPTSSEKQLPDNVAAENVQTNSNSSEPSTSTFDSGRYSPPVQSDLLESSCSEWSDLSLDKSAYSNALHRSSSYLSMLSVASTFLPSPSPDSLSTTSITRIGVVRSEPGRKLPSWMLRVTYLLMALVLMACLSVAGLYGSRFTSSVVLMWLISVFSACLTSILILEPLKVCAQALYLAAVVRPVDPEVEERLGQHPAVKRIGDKQEGKVRPPCGYGLLQAKEEARKVRTLRVLMRNCVIHILFLLVVLLVNYHENISNGKGRLLRSTVTRSLYSGQPTLSALTGFTEALEWLDKTLVPYLHNNHILVLVGLPRLQIYDMNFTGNDGCPPDKLLPTPLFTRHSLDLGISKYTQCGLHKLSEEKQLGENGTITFKHLLTSNWINSGSVAVVVEFTQYHRVTGLFIPVAIRLEHTVSSHIAVSYSIEPFHMPLFKSGPDLQIALVILLLLFAVSFLGAELWAVIQERGQSVSQEWRWLQLLVAVLSLITVASRLLCRYVASACLTRHRTQPHTFTDFRSAALLDRKCSQLSAVLLTLLILKMLGTLRFVKRWMVAGRVLQKTWREICGVILLLLLLLLLFSHTGCLLFSTSVEEFRTLGQSFQTLLLMPRGHVIRKLCDHRPLVGTVYCLSVLGVGLWVLGRLCGVLFIHAYRTVKAEMYQLSVEPQDYEMVEFFIKRLRLWMGLIKTKEFRHKVKFEGMAPPPSRSSQGSQMSTRYTPESPDGLHLASAASSVVSEASTMSSDSYDVQPYLDRLLPSVNAALDSFQRVNQLTDETFRIELQLYRATFRIPQQQEKQDSKTAAHMPSPRPGSAQIPPSPALHHKRNNTPHRRATCSESSAPGVSDHLGETLNVDKPEISVADTEGGTFPRRRAWNSVTSHSATLANKRTPQALCGFPMLVRPKSEAADVTMSHGCHPMKRTAWHPDTEKH